MTVLGEKGVDEEEYPDVLVEEARLKTPNLNCTSGDSSGLLGGGQSGSGGGRSGIGGGRSGRGGGV